jgi:hypothetical protein
MNTAYLFSAIAETFPLGRLSPTCVPVSPCLTEIPAVCPPPLIPAPWHRAESRSEALFSGAVKFKLGVLEGKPSCFLPAIDSFLRFKTHSSQHPTAA